MSRISKRKEDTSSNIRDIMILQQFVESNSLCRLPPVRFISGAETHGAALRVTDMSEAISACKSATSSLCEWRQHPSMFHENNLPALFNLHTSSPATLLPHHSPAPPSAQSLLYLQNSLRWDAARLLSPLAFVWKSNWELLLSLIHFHANKEVVFLFSCKCLFYRRRQV